MCKQTSDLHFCTCASVRQKPLSPGDDGEVDTAEYEKIHFIWTLYKFLGEKDSQMMGDMVIPVEGLEESFTSKYILQQLNSESRFDFEYAPSEGDNLEIRKKYIYKKIKGFTRPDLYDYMSFIYRNGIWQEEVYDVFSDKIRKFKMGIVERA